MIIDLGSVIDVDLKCIAGSSNHWIVSFKMQTDPVVHTKQYASMRIIIKDWPT